MILIERLCLHHSNWLSSLGQNLHHPVGIQQNLGQRLYSLSLPKIPDPMVQQSVHVLTTTAPPKLVSLKYPVPIWMPQTVSSLCSPFPLIPKKMFQPHLIHCAKSVPFSTSKSNPEDCNELPIHSSLVYSHDYFFFTHSPFFQHLLYKHLVALHDGVPLKDGVNMGLSLCLRRENYSYSHS